MKIVSPKLSRYLENIVLDEGVVENEGANIITSNEKKLKLSNMIVNANPTINERNVVDFREFVELRNSLFMFL